jgi:hypothetical protein
MLHRLRYPCTSSSHLLELRTMSDAFDLLPCREQAVPQFGGQGFAAEYNGA